MSCKVSKEMLHGFANNELNEIEKSVVSEHLKSCSTCSNELIEIKRFKQLLGSMKLQGLQLDDIKNNIMSVIRETKKKVPAYDVKVLTRLATSMIACGLIALMLNFTALGGSIIKHVHPVSQAVESTMKRIGQPIAFINKGMTEMSNFMFDINGMMFEIEEKIKGGM